MNPLYNDFQNQNGLGQLLSQIKLFEKTMKGNPRDKVQELLTSGQMTQQQFNALQQQATSILLMLNK